MLLVTSNKRLWALGMVISLAVFAVMYFTVIRPSTNTANQAIKTGLRQSQQAINQADKQLTDAAAQTGATVSQSRTDNASAQTGTTAGHAQPRDGNSQTAAVVAQAQQQLGNAAKLASCDAAAGTDPAKLQSCQSQFGQ
jgi:hypothetical protein